MMAHIPGHDPVMEFAFNEAVGADVVTDSAAAGGVTTGAFQGTILPQIRSTDPSPAGGNYVHLEGSGVFSADPAAPSAGGRIELSELLNPILGGTSTLSFYIRTSQVGVGNAWQSPGVTGAEQGGAGDDVFWGNLNATGQSRVQAGDGAASASTPIADDAWHRVTHSRNATTGVVKTYVDGTLISQATGETGIKGANYRVIGATTNVAGDLTTVQGYTHLNADLDQVEVFNRELSAAEVVRFFGTPAAAVPATPGPVTATANTPSQITLTFTDVADEAGYIIRRSATAGGPFTDLVSLGADQTSYVDRNLTQATPYFYQVVAFNQAGESVAGTANATTPIPAAEPIIVYNFNENTGTRVEDVSTENVDNDATLTGETLPEWRTDSPSPAGGSYLRFAGDGLFNSSGGRVDADDLLNPVLGRSATLAYYIRTEQTGLADAWLSPSVTGAEQAGGGSDIFWGNLDPEGRARVIAGNGAASTSTPLPGAGWVRIVETRDLTTGVVRTYVNGNFVSEAVSETGEKLANFRSFGATTNVAVNLTTVQGYSNFGGDLDQIEVFDRALTALEVTQRYGAPATVVPAAPTPATATVDSPTQVTLTFANVANEAGYIISRGTAAAGPFTELAVLGADATTFVDATASVDTQYFYQITAFNAAGSGAPATVNATTPFPPRNPIIVYSFEDAAAGTTVNNTGTAGDTYDGVLAGELFPTFSTTGASPAGGQFMRFAVLAPGAGTPTFDNTGGRVDSLTALHPVLGGTASISYFIRTTQTGHADAWQSPGVTGAEQAGGGNDIFWGSIGPTGQSRVVAGNGAVSASPPINTGQWVQITHTRNATTGVVRTYVNGVLASQATSETGLKGANFSSIGAVTDVAGNLTTVDGYNYLNGDLDQIEIFDRELSAVEVGRFFGSPTVPVSEVYVRGSTWLGQDNNAATTTFMEYLEAKGLGDDVMGYRVFGAGKTTSPLNPEDILPWINADQIVVRYASAPSGSGIPTPGALTVNGQRNGAYTITAVTPVPNDPTAFILTLNKPLGGGNPVTGTAPTTSENGDRVTVGVPGGGAAGSPFAFTLKVLQGDTDHLNESQHNVLARDFAEVKKKFFKNTNSAVAGTDADYSPFHDVDGNGQILARDFAEVKKRFFQNLPAAPAAAGAALEGSSITSQMFGSHRILG